MDRSALRLMVPTSMSTDETKTCAMAVFEAAIAQLDEEGREPDEWEAGRFLYAISALQSGMYDLAISECLAAAVAACDRSLDDRKARASPGVTKDGLRMLFDGVKRGC